MGRVEVPKTSGLCKTTYDAVIIGSGHNGLIAAAYLAKHGLSVAVLERQDEPGGATVSQRVFPEFDARLSRYSYLVSLLPQLIVDDLQLNFQTRRRSIASCTPYLLADKTPSALVMSNESADLSRASMRQLCGSDEVWHKYQHWLEWQQSLAEYIWPSLLLPLQSRSAFKRNLSRSQIAAWHAFVEQPLGEALEAAIADDLVRGLILTDAKIGVFAHAHDETLLQNRCFLYHTIGQGTGEWRVPVGGMQSLTDALVQCCQKSAVEILCGASVERLTTGRLHTIGFTHLDQAREIDAKYVLVNAGPRTLARLCGQTWNPRAIDEGSVTKVNMLLQSLPQLKAQDTSSQLAFTGSFHVGEGYQQMQRSYEEAARGCVPSSPPFEIYCHTLTDPSILSPELQSRGYHTLTLFGLDMPYRLFTENAEEKPAEVLSRY
ncbi:MAG: NAD(P)/FAD-dependent oxidoreductase, partial [Pirellulaceae bacterium]|nr:NAD(P)/FAD-dependent oxidoreductase [Pirellulaceae bacterium]